MVYLIEISKAFKLVLEKLVREDKMLKERTNNNPDKEISGYFFVCL